ncbi:N-formylglutamate amidohydrolase [Microvirga roseola]|uniref:N-formylglutamate amidohydrolase n=1 Tax=Microvirga roseola TaxID=2883126 RepID=UPI001E635B6A|nr:N-formylglutamate amidohydrolase [Microvirga roseola]
MSIVLATGTIASPQSTASRQHLLAIDEPPPYSVINPDGTSPILLLCEHASNRIPRVLGDIGLPEHERQRHIAWDIGASALAQHLSRSLDAPLFLTNYSRLVVDCNRPFAAPSCIPEVSETTKVPGNQGLCEEERALRIETLFKPFADAVSRRLDILQRSGRRTFVVGIHSFTPVYFGKRRPWEAGVLYAGATEFARSLLAGLREDSRLPVGDNEPYNIHPDEDYTVPVHADGRGLPGVLIEVRQDLINTLDGVAAWGERLERCFRRALRECP